MTATLKITDGTTEVDLLDDNAGFYLNSWRPSIMGFKGGGTFQSSPLSDGRRLVSRQYLDAIDTFNLKIRDGSQDSLIRETQELRRLLEKAVNYWVTDWQDDPVWIEAQATCETNLRYALVKSWSTPSDDNPFAQPFLGHRGSAVMDNWSLVIERGPWLADQPGTGTATAISALEAYDGRNLGNVDSTGARDPTTSNEVYIANKQNVANLTDVYVDDGGAFGPNLMDAALPFDLLPAVPAVNDAIYFGIDTTVADSGPFPNLVFDISIAQNDLTIAWELWSGAWNAVSALQDNTNADGAGTGEPFDTTGVNSVHWNQAPAWVTTAVNGITGYWVRARVTAIGAAPSPPRQQNRDIYSTVWPYIEVQSTEVLGDITALARAQVENQSGAGAGALSVSRVLIGQRSLSRGSSFAAYINVSDEQNIAGITVTATGANTAFTDDLDSAPSGRLARYSPAGVEAMAEQVLISFTDTLSREYYGTYHAYLRTDAASASAGDFEVQLEVNFGNAVLTDVFSLDDTNSEYVLDLGRIVLAPRSLVLPTEEFDSAFFKIRAASTDAAPGTFDMIDLILIPVDEFAADLEFLDDALSRTRYLDIDSVLNPKASIRTLIKQRTDDDILSLWSTKNNGPFAWQANAAQRLWFFSIGSDSVARFEHVHSVVAFRNQRYFSMRGDR